MAIIKATVQIPNDSGLSEDTVANNFYFSTADTAPATLDQVIAALNDFYNVAVAPSVNPITDFLSDFLDGANARIKLVNMSDAPPRFPIRDQAFAMSIPAGNGFPCEVACVTSFQAAKVSGENQARKRGRIYLGPMKSSTGTVVSGDFRVSSAVRTVINAAANRMRIASDGASLWTWVVYSAGARDNSDDTIPYEVRDILPPTFAAVANGWTDDAFDTQRRRGRKASARTAW